MTEVSEPFPNDPNDYLCSNGEVFLVVVGNYEEEEEGYNCEHVGIKMFAMWNLLLTKMWNLLLTKIQIESNLAIHRPTFACYITTHCVVQCTQANIGSIHSIYWVCDLEL